MQIAARECCPHVSTQLLCVHKVQISISEICPTSSTDMNRIDPPHRQMYNSCALQRIHKRSNEVAHTAHCTRRVLCRRNPHWHSPRQRGLCKDSYTIVLRGLSRSRCSIALDSYRVVVVQQSAQIPKLLKGCRWQTAGSRWVAAQKHPNSIWQGKPACWK